MEQPITTENHWHLDKRLNIGHILTTLALVIAAFSYTSGIDKRVTVVEVQVKNQELVNRQTTSQLEQINDKLDRLIERLSVK